MYLLHNTPYNLPFELLLFPHYLSGLLLQIIPLPSGQVCATNWNDEQFPYN